MSRHAKQIGIDILRPPNKKVLFEVLRERMIDSQEIVVLGAQPAKLDDIVLRISTEWRPPRRWNRRKKDKNQITSIHHSGRNTVQKELLVPMAKMYDTTRRHDHIARNTCRRSRRTRRSPSAIQKNLPTLNLRAKNL